MDNLFSAATIFGIVGMAIHLAMPYLYAAIGELFDQTAGCFNLGTEGIMMMGAFSAFYTVYQTGNLLLGIVMAALVGLLMGLIMALISVTFKAAQGISGIGLTMFGVGLSSLLSKTLLEGTVKSVNGFPSIKIPFLSDIPYIGNAFFNHNLMVYIAYLLVPTASLALYKTTSGLKSIGRTKPQCGGYAGRFGDKNPLPVYLYWRRSFRNSRGNFLNCEHQYVSGEDDERNRFYRGCVSIFQRLETQGRAAGGAFIQLCECVAAASTGSWN